jgi:hypothetical protein
MIIYFRPVRLLPLGHIGKPNDLCVRAENASAAALSLAEDLQLGGADIVVLEAAGDTVGDV